jgi:hypothetical protein
MFFFKIPKFLPINGMLIELISHISIFEHNNILLYILNYLCLKDINNLSIVSKKMSKKFKLEIFILKKIEKSSFMFKNGKFVEKIFNYDISLNFHQNEIIIFMIAFKLFKYKNYIGSLKLIKHKNDNIYLNLLKLFNHFKLKNYIEVDQISKNIKFNTYNYIWKKSYIYFSIDNTINYQKYKININSTFNDIYNLMIKYIYDYYS